MDSEYTHLFLLQFFSGTALDVPRGLVEAIGLGVPVESHQTAYRFSPVSMKDGVVEWLYRVSLKENDELRKCMIENLELLDDLKPRLYFYDDGRGVLTLNTELIHDFPSPPAPVLSGGLELGAFEKFIRTVAKDLDGTTILPWGGGSLNMVGNSKATPKARGMAVVSKSPSALGVGGVLGMRRVQVDNMWSGFQESFRLLHTSNVFMHVEETDDISHCRSPKEKLSSS